MAKTSKEKRNEFVEGFLNGVSNALFGLYLFISPLFIQDKLRRIPKDFNIGFIFLPILCVIKLLYGLIHLYFKVNSKEITKLLCTMIFFESVALYSRFTSTVTFKDIYINVDSSTDDSSWLNTFSIIDVSKPSKEMTLIVREMEINSRNLCSFHWFITAGIIGALMVKSGYPEFKSLGYYAFGFFNVVYGFGLLIIDEIQRYICPYMHA